MRGCALFLGASYLLYLAALIEAHVSDHFHTKIFQLKNSNYALLTYLGCATYFSSRPNYF